MLLFWVLFNLFVLAMLALDLGVFHRKSHAVKFKEAVAWSAVWVALACAFAVVVFFWRGRTPALEFSTGYLIELSLSVDNLFVFLVLFSFFKVPGEQQHKVLFWGIIGALVMRFFFIFAGVALINRFHWIIYVFGAFLVYTGVKLATHDDSDVHPERNPVLKLIRRWIPMTEDYHAGHFLITRNGRRIATPLVAVLVAVETTDLMFAVDSIPAVLAISRDPFIVYTSNVFAILGLRSMYFALSGMFNLFQYLNYGLSAILVFFGIKMLLSNDGFTLWGLPLHYKIPTGVSLAVVG
ncbi:MAG: TerC family protein, partial [Acidobacteriales bacterium]|nr:TerC family protein [Terriglobales bacterium]